MKTTTYDPEKWQLVPKTPTKAMLVGMTSFNMPENNYAQLLSAAPQPEEAKSAEPFGYVKLLEMDDWHAQWREWKFCKTQVLKDGIPLYLHPPADAKDEALRVALDALARAHEAFDNVEIFVKSREQIKKPEGHDWFDDELEAIDEALATIDKVLK